MRKSRPVLAAVKLQGISFTHSITTRIVILLLGVLGPVGLIATISLAKREREQLISAKIMAATQSTELFAATVAAALDLGDENDIIQCLEPLRANAAIVYAGVWKEGETRPAGEFGSPPIVPWPPRRSNIERLGDTFSIARPVFGPASVVIGHVGLLISLQSENRAFRIQQIRIATAACVTVLVTVAMLVMVLRWGVILPLKSVARAAVRLAAGEPVRASAYGRGELGQLGRAFNDMANAILEREKRLAAARIRLQTLLDNMGQAIVTFDAKGRILGDRSRQADVLFGPELRDGASICSLLYPAGRQQSVEADAFTSWIHVAFTHGETDWNEVATLAPTNVALLRNGEQVAELDLEFRWVQSDAGPNCVMMVATDATRRRRLERDISRAERDHRKALAALRWLVAGGGQLFVRFLGNSRQRLSAAIRATRATEPFDVGAVTRVFRDVHTVRAEARCFDLELVDKCLTETETQLSELRSGAISEPSQVAKSRDVILQWLDAALRGLDVAEAAFVERSPIGREVLNQMTVRRIDVERLVTLTSNRKDELERIAKRMMARPFGEATMTVADAAQRWAAQVGKCVRVEVIGQEQWVLGRLAERLSGILSHLVRNAIAHGIELPSARTDVGKPACGTIRLICEGGEDSSVICVEDDGQGLDVETLGQGDAERATRAMVEPGVSCLNSVSPLAGHGVGLDAVRNDLNAIDYEIEFRRGTTHGMRVTLAPRAGGIGT